MFFLVSLVFLGKKLVSDWKSTVLPLSACSRRTRTRCLADYSVPVKCVLTSNLNKLTCAFSRNVSLVLGSLGEIRNPDLREKLVQYGFYDTKRGSVVHGGRGYHINILITTIIVVIIIIIRPSVYCDKGLGSEK